MFAAIMNNPGQAVQLVLSGVALAVVAWGLDKLFKKHGV